MFYVLFNNEITMILSNAVKASTNESFAQFFDHNEQLVGFFKLAEIKGFFKDEPTSFYKGV